MSTRPSDQKLALPIPPRNGEGDRPKGGGGVAAVRPDERFRPLRQPCGLPPPRSGEELATSAPHHKTDIRLYAAGFNPANHRRISLSSRMRASDQRSEEHTSELQSLMRISYAVFCLKKKKTNKTQ